MVRMTPDCHRVEATLMTMQRAFLEEPGLTLTLSEAARQFGVDTATCRTLFEVLTDAHVLTTTSEGAYSRYFPHHGRAARNGASMTISSGPGQKAARQAAPFRAHAA